MNSHGRRIARRAAERAARAVAVAALATAVLNRASEWLAVWALDLVDAAKRLQAYAVQGATRCEQAGGVR